MSNLHRLTNESALSLEADGFTVGRGWDKDVARALVRGAHQPHIMSKAPGDLERRFRTMHTAEV